MIRRMSCYRSELLRGLGDMRAILVERSFATRDLTPYPLACYTSLPHSTHLQSCYWNTRKHSILRLSVKEPPQHPNNLSSNTFFFFLSYYGGDVRPTGWRRLIGCPKLQIIFHKRATKYRALLPKMTYSDKGSYESWPPCIVAKDSVVSF